MKKNIVTIIIAAGLIYILTTDGFGKHQHISLIPEPTIEKALASEADADTITLGVKSALDDSIFSWPTIIILSLGVISITVFRRNNLA